MYTTFYSICQRAVGSEDVCAGAMLGERPLPQTPWPIPQQPRSPWGRSPNSRTPSLPWRYP